MASPATITANGKDSVTLPVGAGAVATLPAGRWVIDAPTGDLSVSGPNLKSAEKWSKAGRLAFNAVAGGIYALSWKGGTYSKVLAITVPEAHEPPKPDPKPEPSTFTPTNSFVTYGASADPTPPTDPALLKLWNATVRKGPFCAVAVGERLILDVKHNGVPKAYTLADGSTVNVVRSLPVAQQDVALHVVDRDLLDWVPMPANPAVRPARAVYVASGTGKSAEVKVGDKLVGWKAVGPQGTKGWAELPVVQFAAPGQFNDHRWVVLTFGANDGAIAVTGGCSGSPLFGQIDGQWYTLGVTKAPHVATSNGSDGMIDGWYPALFEAAALWGPGSYYGSAFLRPTVAEYRQEPGLIEGEAKPTLYPFVNGAHLGSRSDYDVLAPALTREGINYFTTWDQWNDSTPNAAGMGAGEDFIRGGDVTLRPMYQERTQRFSDIAKPTPGFIARLKAAVAAGAAAGVRVDVEGGNEWYDRWAINGANPYRPALEDYDTVTRRIQAEIFDPIAYGVGQANSTTPSFSVHDSTRTVLTQMKAAGGLDPKKYSRLAAHVYFWSGTSAEQIRAAWKTVREFWSGPIDVTEWNLKGKWTLAELLSMLDVHREFVDGRWAYMMLTPRWSKKDGKIVRDNQYPVRLEDDGSVPKDSVALNAALKALTARVGK